MVNLVTGPSECHKAVPADHHLDSELFLISYNLELYFFFYLLALDILFIFGTYELSDLYIRDVYMKPFTTTHSINDRGFYCSL